MHHLHENTSALQNGLVVADVGKACHEVFNSKLFLQLESENLRLVEQLHIDVDPLFSNFVQNVLDSIELVFLDGILKFCLELVDLIVTGVAAGDWSFFDGGCLVFIDPVSCRALVTEELLTALTVITDIYEIECCITTD